MHEHEVKDKDTKFVIDDLLNITGSPKALKRGDHASEIYSFEMPRYYEGHDMSKCNTVEVHYNNVSYDSSTRTTTTNSSFDAVDNFRLLEDEDKVVFEWLIKGDATQLDGTLNFCIRLACINEGNIEYQKFTNTFEGVQVGASIYNTSKIENQYNDVIAELNAHKVTLRKRQEVINPEFETYASAFPTEPGIYDASDNMLASWDELVAWGYDATTNINPGNYSTVSYSLYSVLKNRDLLLETKKIIIAEGVNRIPMYWCYGCNNLEWAKFPSTITEMEDSIVQTLTIMYFEKFDTIPTTRKSSLYNKTDLRYLYGGKKADIEKAFANATSTTLVDSFICKSIVEKHDTLVIGDMEYPLYSVEDINEMIAG